MLRVLHKDSPLCLKHYAQAAISDAFWLPALRLPEAVMRGQNYVTEMLGSSAFEFLGQREEDARLFSAAMTDLSIPVIRDAVGAIDVGDAHLVVDVGGANDAFVAELLASHPDVKGVVFVLHDGENAVAALMDLGMLHAFTGREREASEFRHLLESAGLAAERISPLHPPYQLIEAVAA
jgi:hypothetical protein